MKNIKIITLFILSALVFTMGCRDDEFTTPDLPANVAPPITTSIYELKNILYQPEAGTELMYIDTNIVIGGQVIANDSEGNFYKTLVLQDSTAGIEISINAYGLQGTYPLGKRVHVKCEGLYLGDYGGITKLGSEYEGGIGRIEEPLVKYHLFVDDAEYPLNIEFKKMNELTPRDLNTLVKFDSVQFKLSELGKTYADAENLIDGEIQLQDPQKNSITVKTSGYANFASDSIPSGMGQITLVYSEYNGSSQFQIRNINEVKLDNPRYGAIYEKDFEDFSLTSGGWSVQTPVGTAQWAVSSYSSNNYAKITNYDYGTGSNAASEAWLISPALDLSGINAPYLNFMSDVKYTGPALQVKISTDYDGTSAPADATWTELTAVLDTNTGSYNWQSSGDIDLSAYANTPFYIAFIYTGSDSQGATWQLDDIGIYETK